MHSVQFAGGDKGNERYIHYYHYLEHAHNIIYCTISLSISLVRVRRLRRHVLRNRAGRQFDSDLENTRHVGKEIVSIAKAARQLRQRFPRSLAIPPNLVRPGTAHDLLGVRLLFHASLPHRRPAELRPQVSHTHRSADL